MENAREGRKVNSKVKYIDILYSTQPKFPPSCYSRPNGNLYPAHAVVHGSTVH